MLGNVQEGVQMTLPVIKTPGFTASDIRSNKDIKIIGEEKTKKRRMSWKTSGKRQTVRRTKQTFARQKGTQKKCCGQVHRTAPCRPA